MRKRHHTWLLKWLLPKFYCIMITNLYIIFFILLRFKFACMFMMLFFRGGGVTFAHIAPPHPRVRERGEQPPLSPPPLPAPLYALFSLSGLTDFCRGVYRGEFGSSLLPSGLGGGNKIPPDDLFYFIFENNANRLPKN